MDKDLIQLHMAYIYFGMIKLWHDNGGLSVGMIYGSRRGWVASAWRNGTACDDSTFIYHESMALQLSQDCSCS